MADNFTFTQGAGATGGADLISTVLYPRVKLIQGIDGTNDGDTSSALPFPIRLAPFITSASTFNRPATDALAYALGDIVANSTTAASVVSYTIQAARVADAPGRLSSCRLQKSGTSVTNALFRVHIFNASAGVANGDNGVFTPSNVANWIGSMDVTVDRVASDGAFGVGYPKDGNYLNYTPATGTANLMALLEARGSYTPTSAEAYTLQLVTE